MLQEVQGHLKIIFGVHKDHFRSFQVPGGERRQSFFFFSQELPQIPKGKDTAQFLRLIENHKKRIGTLLGPLQDFRQGVSPWITSIFLLM